MQRTQGLQGPILFLEGRCDHERMLVIRIAAATLASDSAITIVRFRPSKLPSGLPYSEVGFANCSATLMWHAADRSLEATAAFCSCSRYNLTLCKVLSTEKDHQHSLAEGFLLICLTCTGCLYLAQGHSTSIPKRSVDGEADSLGRRVALEEARVACDAADVRKVCMRLIALMSHNTSNNSNQTLNR